MPPKKKPVKKDGNTRDIVVPNAVWKEIFDDTQEDPNEDERAEILKELREVTESQDVTGQYEELRRSDDAKKLLDESLGDAKKDIKAREKKLARFAALAAAVGKNEEFGFGLGFKVVDCKGKLPSFDKGATRLALEAMDVEDIVRILAGKVNEIKDGERKWKVGDIASEFTEALTAKSKKENPAPDWDIEGDEWKAFTVKVSEILQTKRGDGHRIVRVAFPESKKHGRDSEEDELGPPAKRVAVSGAGTDSDPAQREDAAPAFNF